MRRAARTLTAAALMSLPAHAQAPVTSSSTAVPSASVQAATADSAAPIGSNPPVASPGLSVGFSPPAPSPGDSAVVDNHMSVPRLDDAVNEPAVNKPAVNKPAVNEPAVNEPAVNEPAVNEPAVNDADAGASVQEPTKLAPARPDSSSVVASTPPAPDDSTWNILPVISGGDEDDIWDVAERVFPAIGTERRGGGGPYLILAVITALIAFAFGRMRRQFPMRGLLPRSIAYLHVGTRTMVVLFGLVAAAHWIPSSYAPVVPWVALAAAAAAGWSARDFLPDLFAGIVIIIERRVRLGLWVLGQDFAGEVETLGPRVARLRDSEGRLVSVPNRKLLVGPVTVEASRQHTIDVVMRVPEGTGAEQARRAIEDAALLSPWRAMHELPEVRRDGQDPRAWRVRVRLLEPRFVRAFESALIDHVEEMLVPFE